MIMIITTMRHEDDGDTSCNWCAWNNQQGLGKGTARLGNKKTCGNHPNNSITKVSLNTEKSPGDLTSLAVSKDPGRNH